MWPGSGHGVERVRRREESSRGIQAVAARTAMVAGPVQALVVKPRDVSQGAQEGGGGEDALGVVRMQPEAFPFRCSECARLLPDVGWHPHSAEVVEVSCTAQFGYLGLVQAAKFGCGGSQLGDAGRVAGEGGSHEIGEVTSAATASSICRERRSL